MTVSPGFGILLQARSLLGYEVGGFNIPAYSPDGRWVAIGTTEAMKADCGFPTWHSAQELIAYAREHCVFRERQRRSGTVWVAGEMSRDVPPGRLYGTKTLTQVLSGQSKHKGRELMEQRQQLIKAIAEIEAQRGVLSDDVIEALVSALRNELAELGVPETTAQVVTILFTDIVASTEPDLAIWTRKRTWRSWTAR